MLCIAKIFPHFFVLALCRKVRGRFAFQEPAMNIPLWLLCIPLIVFIPHIAAELRRIAVSIASELKAAKDQIAAIQGQVAEIAAPDLSGINGRLDTIAAQVAAVQVPDVAGITQQIADINQKLADMSALVGTPAELNP